MVLLPWFGDTRYAFLRGDIYRRPESENFDWIDILKFTPTYAKMTIPTRNPHLIKNVDPFWNLRGKSVSNNI